MTQIFQSLLGTIVAVLLAYMLIFVLTPNSILLNTYPLIALCVMLAFLIQWIAFVPAFVKQTEFFYDLTGSLTYLSVTALALFGGNVEDPRSQIIALLVSLWAIRLGAFLFLRIYQTGSDSRFGPIKPSFLKFFMTWTLQGMWVVLTLAAGLAVMTSQQTVPMEPIGYLGVGIWVLGFFIEVWADEQKRRHRADSQKRGRFIRSGLWAWSRHPNYFGEILTWTGIAVTAVPALQGGQYFALLSPVFVYLLLTHVSGIPLLEKKADQTWGDQEDYRIYKQNTPILFPKLPARK